MGKRLNIKLRDRTNKYAKQHPQLTEKRFTRNAILVYLSMLCFIIIFSTSTEILLLHFMCVTVIYGSWILWVHGVIDWVKEELEEVVEDVVEAVEEAVETVKEKV